MVCAQRYLLSVKTLLTRTMSETRALLPSFDRSRSADEAKRGTVNGLARGKPTWHSALLNAPNSNSRSKQLETANFYSSHSSKARHRQGALLPQELQRALIPGKFTQ